MNLIDTMLCQRKQAQKQYILHYKSIYMKIESADKINLWFSKGCDSITLGNIGWLAGAS